jgi:uncharacterized membrane protein YsdA (DUF1294 family)
VRDSLLLAAANIWARREEALLVAALLGGWMLVTYGIAGYFRARIVWPMSIGLLLLTASGWSVIASIASKGLYVAHRAAKRKAATGAG